jgi:drug/metabolite transporter (DMT)-like permease
MMSPQIATVLSLVLAYFLWSTGFIVLKASLAWLGPLSVMTVRMLPAFVLYLIFRKRMQPEKWHREDVKWLLLMTLFDPLGTLLLQTHALPLTTASQSGMIFACMPLLMVGAARVLMGERIRRRCLAGILVAFAGVSMVTLTGGANAYAPNPVLGNTLSFFAICSLLGYSLTVKRLAARYRPSALIFAQTMIANAVQIPLFLLLLPDNLPVLQAAPWKIFGALFYMGIFPVCVGYYLVNRGISRIKAAYVSLCNSLMPAFVLLLGHLILDERLVMPQYAGAALIFAGVILAGLPEATSTSSVTTDVSSRQ